MELREEQVKETPGQAPPEGGQMASEGRPMASEGKEKSERKYTRKLESKLKEWTAQIERLRVKAKVAEEDMKIKYDREIGNLEKKKEVVEKGLREIMKSSDEAWEAVKHATDKAMSDFKQALDAALSKVKKSK